MPTVDELLGRTKRELREVEGQLAAALKEDRTRKRGALNRQIHDVRRMLDPTRYPYHSQAGQDMVVDRMFAGKTGGTFVDVGGYDGLTGSNSLFFEKWRGWTGVLIEPVPAQLNKAKAVRTCPCLGLAVAARDGQADFIEITEGYTQMSGLAQSYEPGLLGQVRDDPRHKEVTLRVETRTLSRILTDAGLSDPDFVSLDIEGGEIETLSAFPFDAHNVKVWSIENNTGGPEIGAIMQAQGYMLADLCGPDEIWRKPDL